MSFGGHIGATVIAGLMLVSPVRAGTPIILTPDQDVAARVANAPEGAVLQFEAGHYREVTLNPRDGQQLVGRPGAVLSGARVLTDWKRAGGHWTAQVSLTRYSRPGVCAPDRPDCREREMLFVDGVRVPRAARGARLEAGQWRYGDGIVRLALDPTDRLVEFSVTPSAITGDATGVVLSSLIVEKYRPGAQAGAIDGARGVDWRIKDMVARWNHGVGIALGNGASVEGGTFSHNAQLGLRAEFGQVHVTGSEIAHNNWAGYDGGWEAGGTKFLELTALHVTGTCVHHNEGPGLWTDANNVNVVFENNLVFANAGDGIKHEISYAAQIRDNTVVYNGFGQHRWLWGSQILVQNSADTLVENNLVDTHPDGGNGIGIIQQDRDVGGGGFFASGNRVVGNTVILRGRARQGMGADFDRHWFWRQAENRFADNLYVVESAGRRFWYLRSRPRRFSYATARGQDRGSQVRVEPDRPMLKPDCATRQKR